MGASEELFRLPFDSSLQLIENWVSQLPLKNQYAFVMRDYIGHLLEELCVKIWDPQADSAVIRATAYLKQIGVDGETAHFFSHQVLDSVWGLLISYFPDLNFQMLSAGRYLIAEDMSTLLVYLVRN